MNFEHGPNSNIIEDVEKRLIVLSLQKHSLSP